MLFLSRVHGKKILPDLVPSHHNRAVSLATRRGHKIALFNAISQSAIFMPNNILLGMKIADCDGDISIFVAS